MWIKFFFNHDERQVIFVPGVVRKKEAINGASRE